MDQLAEDVQRFIARVERCFRPGYRSGVLQFCIGDDEAGRFHATLGAAIEFGRGEFRAAQTRISMSEAAFHALAQSGAAEVDAELRVEGDRDLATLVAQAAKGENAPGLVRLRKLDKEIARRAPFDAAVERRPMPTPGELMHLVARGRATIVLGALQGGSWTSTPHELQHAFGDVPLTALDAEVLGATRHADRVGTLLQQAVAGDNSSVYTGGCALPGPMHAAFELPLLASSYFTRPQLWLGSRATTRLHRDFLHGFIGEVWGVKHFVLYPPDDAPRLSGGACFDHFELSLFDPFAADFDRFPNARDARRVDVDLAAGELLVLPAGWFHAVESRGPVMSVNRFIREPAWESLSRRGAEQRG